MVRKKSESVMGAIVGDIVGSIYEFNNHRSKDFPLFSNECFPTDDSIMTLSVANALMKCNGDYDKLSDETVKAMQSIGRNYPNCGYGGRFDMWVYEENPQPYYSFGNGSAMRVSPVAYVAKNKEEVIELSNSVTKVTHNHPEGLKGAKATAVAAWMALNNYLKNDILYEMGKYYEVNFTLDEIRYTYQFNETCQETVPQAIECFAEGTDFEDVIRNAISIGGDSDTIAAIAGAIAGAYYGVPEDIYKKARGYLDGRLTGILNDFIDFAG